MKFTAIDFETANASMLSACSIGVVEFEDNVPVKETITLIRPPEEYGKFNWYNVRIHGIKKNMVKDAPTFDQVWERIHSSIENQLIVCHNAAFDTAVLCKLLEYYGIPVPNFDYVCTVKISQLLWPEMQNHKLDTVCAIWTFASIITKHCLTRARAVSSLRRRLRVSTVSRPKI